MQYGYQIKVKNTHDLLLRGLRYFLGDKAVWLPEYDQIADWMSDNKGKGLLCVGGCGRGKTVICQRFLPLVFQRLLRLNYNCYDASQMLEQMEDIKESWAVCIDDIGSEGRFMVYGDEKKPLWEIIDHAEKNEHLLVLTTNLNIDELENKYGVRTIDRLIAITRLVAFKGDSLR